jgi:hypothetical protein
LTLAIGAAVVVDELLDDAVVALTASSTCYGSNDYNNHIHSICTSTYYMK